MKRLSFIIFILLFSAFTVLAATILTDNFNSYNNGDLNGQGGWSSGAGTDVQDTVIYEGAKSVIVTDATVVANNTDTQDSGTIVVYARVHTVSSDSIYISFRTASDQAMLVMFEADGHIWWRYGGGTNADTGISYNIDTWYGIKFIWTHTQYQVEIDGAGLTAAQNCNYAHCGDVNTIQIYGVVSQNAYFDYIAEDYYEEESYVSTLDYTFVLAIILLGVFLLILFYFIYSLLK